MRSFLPKLCNINEDTTLTSTSPSLSIKSEEVKLNPKAVEFVPSSFDASNTTKDSVLNPNTCITPQKQKSYKKIEKFVPNYKPRAKLNIYIGKTETKNILSQLNELFPNTTTLYQYLDVTTSFQMIDNQMYLFQTNKEPIISFINFDLHTKDTKELLYGIVLPNDSSKIKKCNEKQESIENTKWLWKVYGFLTTKQIYYKYGIQANDLPKSSREMHGLSQIASIKSEQINSNILYDINWSVVQQIGKVFKYKCSKSLKVELDTKSWIKNCEESWDEFVLMPIIVYDIKHNGLKYIFNYWIEWVKLLKINVNNVEYSIGVSFKKCESKLWKIQSLYLNKVDIANAHRLLGCFTSNYTRYVDDKFEAFISEIQWQ